MTEAVWYEPMDIIRRKFDLCWSYRIVKLENKWIEIWMRYIWDYVRELFTIEIGVEANHSFDWVI